MLHGVFQYTNWQYTLNKNLKGMSSYRAHELLAKIQKTGSTIFQPEVRELTGGYNSQAINGLVKRKLGVIAGIIKVSK